MAATVAIETVAPSLPTPTPREKLSADPPIRNVRRIASST